MVIGMRKASLGTLFLTVFLDLLGFGLVVPFLPRVARSHGGSDFVAALLMATFSSMQFVFIPLWGRLSDRVGRRPVLLWSMAASAVGMTMLGMARSLPMLFLARGWSGIATANISVAQAYIADVTAPETRARGMGIIGIGFGLGFIIGPFVGGELGRFEALGQEGTLAALAAATLSVLNVILASFTLPESLLPEGRGPRSRRPIWDIAALTQVARLPGLSVLLAITFFVMFWFSGLETTFSLFAHDAFDMSIAQTGRVFAFVGMVGVIVQSLFIDRLTRQLGEVRMLRMGLLFMAIGFALDGISIAVGEWFVVLASGSIGCGNALYSPTVASYASRQAGADSQGLALGVIQSTTALARVMGPLIGGISYEIIGFRGPCFLGALGIIVMLIVSSRLVPLRPGSVVAVRSLVGSAA